MKVCLHFARYKHKQTFFYNYRSESQKCKLTMAEKFFNNSLGDFKKEAVGQLLQGEIISPDHKVSLELNAKWKATMKKLKNLDVNDYSVYTGTSGIALLKMKKDPDNPVVLQEIKNLLVLSPLKGKRPTFLCGDSGPLAIRAVVFDKLGLHEQAAKSLISLKALSKDVVNVESDLSNELMYGRAGYLFAVLYVNQNMQTKPFDDEFIRSIIEAILLSGQNLSKAGRFKCPLMYEWHESYYFGAAHGLTGILYLLLQARQYLTDVELNLIKPTIDYIATQRFPSGNFPSSLGRDQDKYVQWCHGAPGPLYLFTTAYKVYQNPEYLQFALECGEIIWERGLLTKGYSICHGVSGNAYCFLELYQTTNDEKHLYRALKFAEWCLEYNKDYERCSPDRPLSLFEGIAGPMYLLVDIQKPLQAKFPGFTI